MARLKRSSTCEELATEKVTTLSTKSLLKAKGHQQPCRQTKKTNNHTQKKHTSTDMQQEKGRMGKKAVGEEEISAVHLLGNLSRRRVDGRCRPDDGRYGAAD